MGEPGIERVREQETNMRRTITAALVAAACGTGLATLDATPAAAQENARPNLQMAYPSDSYTQYYRGRGYYGRPYGYRHRRGYGGAAAAGIAGLAAGALIGGAIAS